MVANLGDSRVKIVTARGKRVLRQQGCGQHALRIGAAPGNCVFRAALCGGSAGALGCRLTDCPYSRHERALQAGIVPKENPIQCEPVCPAQADGLVSCGSHLAPLVLVVGRRADLGRRAKCRLR